MTRSRGPGGGSTSVGKVGPKPRISYDDERARMQRSIYDGRNSNNGLVEAGGTAHDVFVQTEG